MIRPAGVLALAIVLGLAAPPITSSAQEGESGADTRGDFPHGAHAGLFPLCTGCHTGVPSSS